MKKITALLFFFSSILSFAQMRRPLQLDSMLKELSSAKYNGRKDTATVKLLCGIAYNYFLMCNDSSGMYAGEALKISEMNGYNTWQAVSLEAMGKYHYNDYNTALGYLLRALEIYEQGGDNINTAKVQYAIGGVYFNMGKFSEALDYFAKSKSYYDRVNNKTCVAAVNHSISACYINTNQFDTALKYESSALQYFRDAGEQQRIASSYLNIGCCYTGLKKYNKALVYNYACLRLYEPGSVDAYRYATALSELGYTYFRVAVDSTSAITPDSLLPAGRSANLAKAIQYFRDAYKVYEESPEFPPTDILERLSNALAAAGAYEEALVLHKRWAKIKDSMLSRDVQLKIAAQETKRETELKEKQIEINKVQAAGKRNERILYCISLALLGTGIGLTLRNQKKEKHANARLATANKRLAAEKENSDNLALNLQSSLEEKEILLSEVHHRVKNNLQMITSLLQLQSSRARSDDAKKALLESEARVMSMAIIHQKLYQREQLNSVDIHSLAGELFCHIKNMSPKLLDEVCFVNDLPLDNFDLETVIPLGLILNELITNSFKYAIPHSETLVITVSMYKADQYTVLRYADNGQGLPAGVDVKNGRSLGLHLVRRLARQLGGHVAYVYENGSVFNVNFL